MFSWQSNFSLNGSTTTTTTTTTRARPIGHDWALLQVFKWCDPVSLRRGSQVCRRWRHLIQQAIAQQETRNDKPVNKDNQMDERNEKCFRKIAKLGRLYVPDRRRIILERLRTKDEIQNDIEQQAARLKHGTANVRSIQSGSNLMSNGATLLTRSKALQSRERRPSDSVYVDDRVADNTQKTSWAFSWNVQPWIDAYDIQEVVLHNFCAFLEREITEMAEPSVPNQSAGRDALAHSHSVAYLHTPPYSPGNSPCHGQGHGHSHGHGHGVTGSHTQTNLMISYESRDIATMPDPNNIWNSETMEEILSLSSGRIERFAQVLARVNPLHLVVKDTTRRIRRPIRVVFYAIKLLRPHLRRLTLDNLTGSESVELSKWLNLSGIERLVIRQPSSHSAFTVNEQLLFKWLRLPESRRCKISMEFHGCNELTAEGLAKFIKAWQLTPEVCEFETIRIDCQTLQPVEFLAVVNKKPSERLSSTLFWEYKQRATLNDRKIEFQHERSGSVIRFSTDQRMMTLKCVRGSLAVPLISRRSAPSIQALDARHGLTRSDDVASKGSLANLLAAGDVSNLMKSLFYSNEQKKRLTQIA